MSTDKIEIEIESSSPQCSPEKAKTKKPRIKKEKHALLPYYFEDKLEASLDEAGLGCLSGPVVAAAVIWPHPSTFDEEHQKDLAQINDSKQLTLKKRKHLKTFIENYAIDYSVQFIDVETVDKINVYHARFKAMHNAIRDLKLKPERLVIDGDKFTPYFDKPILEGDNIGQVEVIPHACIIGGDAKYQGIAAASILAKCARDEYMEALHEEYPHYGWDTNKGYGTKAHYDALKKHGVTIHHRKSFNLHLN